MLHYLFYYDLGSDLKNLVFLLFRVLLCLQIIRVHGVKKLAIGESAVLPNPFHLPSGINHLAAMFSSLIAPAFVALGLFTRLMAALVLAVTLTGYFIVHR